MKTSDVQKAELTHATDVELRPPEHLRTEGENGEQDIDSVPLYRKKRVLIPLFVVLLATAAAVWYWYTVFRNYDSTDDAFIDADRVEISSKILGRITKMAVDEGDSVKEGEVIVRLDDSDLRAQEEQAKAVLVSAEQNVTLAKVNLDKAVL
jgi:multidrug resistance efflux pump